MTQSLSCDQVVDLPLSDMQFYLENAGAKELRDLRLYIGLGSTGTKDENKAFFLEHFARARSLPAGLQPPEGPVTRSAARAVPARGRALDSSTDAKLMTPERAGGRHRSPHGGEVATDPFLAIDHWNSVNL